MDLNSLISCSRLDFMDTQSLRIPSFSINFLHGLLPDQPKLPPLSSQASSPLINLSFLPPHRVEILLQLLLPDFAILSKEPFVSLALILVPFSGVVLCKSLLNVTFASQAEFQACTAHPIWTSLGSGGIEHFHLSSSIYVSFKKSCWTPHCLISIPFIFWPTKRVPHCLDLIFLGYFLLLPSKA